MKPCDEIMLCRCGGHVWHVHLARQEYGHACGTYECVRCGAITQPREDGTVLAGTVGAPTQEPTARGNAPA